MIYLDKQELEILATRVLEGKYYFEEIFEIDITLHNKDVIDLNINLKESALIEIDRIFYIVGSFISDIIPADKEIEAFEDIFSSVYDWLDHIIPNSIFFQNNSNYELWIQDIYLKVRL